MISKAMFSFFTLFSFLRNKHLILHKNKYYCNKIVIPYKIKEERSGKKLKLENYTRSMKC